MFVCCCHFFFALPRTRFTMPHPKLHANKYVACFASMTTFSIAEYGMRAIDWTCIGRLDSIEWTPIGMYIFYLFIHKPHLHLVNGHRCMRPSAESHPCHISGSSWASPSPFCLFCGRGSLCFVCILVFADWRAYHSFESHSADHNVFLIKAL